MNDHDDRADLALRQLGTSAVPLESAERLAERRARLLPALSALADAEAARVTTIPRGKRVVAAIIAVAAVAACATALFVVRAPGRVATLRAKEGTVRLVHGGVTSAGNVPTTLAVSDSLETLDGSAELGLVTGAILELAAQSRLELSAEDRSANATSERVRLSSGRIAVRVPKLPAGSKLMIGTPDATVTVHGTAFTVEVSKTASGLDTTTVVVTEGRVAVDSGEQHLFLGPGSRWSSPPRAVDAPPLAVAASAAPSQPTTPDETAGSVSSSSRRSTLRDENELFRAAMAAERAGQYDKAASLSDRLLHTYPDTPLAAEARALNATARRNLETSP